MDQASSLAPGRHTQAEDSPTPGQTRSPILIPVLAYLTLQLYLYYWIWTVSEEVERFDPHERSPHAPARWGVPLALAGMVVVGVSLSVLLFADLLVPVGAILEGRVGTGLALVGLGVFVGGAAYAAGSGLIWIAYWRLWRATRTHERNLGYQPLRPSLMLGLWVGSLLAVGLVPMLGWAVQLAARSYVLYRTQRGLNRVWTGAAGGYQAPAPRSPLWPMAPVDPGPEPRPPPRHRRPPPLRPGDVAVDPPSARREPPGEEAVAVACPGCGHRERVPAGRAPALDCPVCGRRRLRGEA